jgi:hypothetical protein
MQPQNEAGADAAPRRGTLQKGARATRKALGNAAAAFGGLWRARGEAAAKPPPPRTMELQEMRGASSSHRKSGSESSALTDTSADQAL